MVLYNLNGYLTIVPETVRQMILDTNVPSRLSIDDPSGDILLREFTGVHNRAKKAADEVLGQLKHRLATATA